MIRLAVTEARAHARRLVLVAVAIAVAVTFMSGTFVLADSVQTTTVAQASVQPPGLAVAVYGDGSLPARTAADISGVPGVAQVAPVVAGYAQLVAGGQLVGTADSVVVSVSTYSDLRVGHIVAGHLPTGGGQVVVQSATFDSGHFRLGQRVRVVSSIPAEPFTIVGVQAGVSVPGSPGATVIGVDSSDAQRLTGLHGRLSEVLVSATPDVTPEALASRLQSRLGSSDQVLTRSHLTALVVAQSSSQVLSFTTTLDVLIGIALVVGIFIIVNAFSLLVAQRRRELALLRCLGTSRTQLALLVTGEAGLVGVVASAVGLGLGFVAAVALRGLVRASGTALPTGPLGIHWSEALVCLAAGTGAAILASVIPAWQAGRVPALVALRVDPVSESGVAHPARRPVALTLALLGAGLLVGTLLAGVPVGVVVGAVLVVSGLAGLSQAPVAATAGALGWPVERFGGFAGGLGRQNAMRHPRRTAASAASVVVGVGLICALAVIANSARTSSTGQLNRTVLAGYVLTTAGSGSPSNGPSAVQPMPTSVVPRLRSTPGLALVSPTSYLNFQVAPHQSNWGAAIDPATYSRVVGLGPIRGSLAGLDTGGFAVQQSIAQAEGWHLGEMVSFIFPEQFGSTTVIHARRPISAIFDSLGYYGGFLFSASSLTAVYPDLPPSVIFVDGAPGAGPSATRAALARALVGYPQVAVADPAQVEADQNQSINHQVDLVAVLSLLALIIGYLGMVTNLTLSITERVREIGLLRAVGMSSRQLGAALRLESAIIAALGAVVGAVLGVGGAWVLQRSLASDGLTELSVPWLTLVLYMIVAVVVGVVAGVLPARQARRIPVLEALADE